MNLGPTFTPANQLTMMRMLLIPAFVILLMYGYRGWALVTFLAAGLTDLFDGLIARMTGDKTTLGAWLDPMADKLLLLTMFVMLTLPEIGRPNRLPLWFTVLVISRDVAIVATVAVVNLAIGPRTFRPSIYGKIATPFISTTWASRQPLCRRSFTAPSPSPSSRPDTTPSRSSKWDTNLKSRSPYRSAAQVAIKA